ncbi:Cytochrome P450 3A19 [Trichoplax sp. H2]|nr:Cytochrome P450 3A19 [Trichoplax sp. H2]|eukprot:RDD40232.1 Cytochrome P450 3A19 [Trichoplax sp. H2]
MQQCPTVVVDYRILASGVISVAIFVPLYYLHHNPEVWPESEKFDPERFTKEAVEARHPCAFSPFATGPRNCIGMRFALMEIKLSIAKIIHRFKLLTSPETEIPVKVVAISTLKPKNALHLRVESV